MIKAMLFDYGGTLDSGARHWFYVLYEGFLNSGVTLSEEDFRPAYVCAERALAKHCYINTTDTFFTLLYKKVLLETEYLEHNKICTFQNSHPRTKVAEQVANFCNDFAREHVRSAIPLLMEFQKKYTLVMVSNFYGNLSAILQSFGVSDFFPTIIESAVVGVRKPSPDIFKLAVQAVNVRADECVVIGDSYTKDIMPANSIGCETVWFKGVEWESVERDETLPTHVISSLSELRQWY